jgi:hypothetical protein
VSVIPIERALAASLISAQEAAADEPPAGEQWPEWVSLEDCRPHDSPFGRRVREAAAGNDIEPRALAVRTLLHLPRVARLDGRVRWGRLEDELRRRATELKVDQAKAGALVPRARFELKRLQFVADYNADKAADIFTNLHYLHSARAGSLNYALVDPYDERPVSLCSVSPLEWRRVGRQINNQFGAPMSTVWDISRVYSFDVAPPNAISYLLARVRNDIRLRVPEAEVLSTAVDPNLGFSGASYLAANWQRWMTIKARPYFYFDGDYISPRQLRVRFDTTNVAELETKYGERFRSSKTPLLDSMIFCCRVKGETEAVPEGQERRLYSRASTRLRSGIELDSGKSAVAHAIAAVAHSACCSEKTPLLSISWAASAAQKASRAADDSL